MEPPKGVERQVEDLQHTLRLLVGLILPCLFLLCLLSCLFLLHWRPSRGKVQARGLQGVPGGPAAPLRAGSRAAVKQLWQPGIGPAGLSGRPLPSCCSGRASPACGSRRHAPRPKLGFCSQPPPQGQPRNGASSSTITTTSGDLGKVLVPPNSPATSSGTGGAPEGAFPGYLTSTQDKVRSRGRSAPAAHAHVTPFEYGSSIRREGRRARLDSANFTASQGPGLDTDFGASAGVSVRILSSGSEESPKTPLLHGQRLGRLEWDYYDPGYQRATPLPHQPPPIDSKQYWL